MRDLPVNLRHSTCYVPLVEQSVVFKGYLNVSKLPENPQPIQSKCGIQKSVFFSMKVISAVFQILYSKYGYLPGEEVAFQIIISNPKLFILSNFSAQLVQQTVYNVPKAAQSRNRFKTVTRFEILEVTDETEIYWTEGIRIPQSCIPSCTEKPPYNVIYFL